MCPFPGRIAVTSDGIKPGRPFYGGPFGADASRLFSVSPVSRQAAVLFAAVSFLPVFLASLRAPVAFAAVARFRFFGFASAVGCGGFAYSFFSFAFDVGAVLYARARGFVSFLCCVGRAYRTSTTFYN